MQWLKKFLGLSLASDTYGSDHAGNRPDQESNKDPVAHMLEHPGRTFGESVAEVTQGANLVEGKQAWELADEHKHDIDKMKACCEAEVKTFRMTSLCPAPYYFERVAIISRKAKNYAQEVEFCEMYINSISEYDQILAEKGGCDPKSSPRYRNICKRLGKAEELLAKQEGR